MPIVAGIRFSLSVRLFVIESILVLDDVLCLSIWLTGRILGGRGTSTMAFYFHWFLRHNINMRRDYCSVVFVKLFAERHIRDSIDQTENSSLMPLGASSVLQRTILFLKIVAIYFFYLLKRHEYYRNSSHGQYVKIRHLPNAFFY